MSGDSSARLRRLWLALERFPHGEFPDFQMARLYGVPGGSCRVLAYYPYRLWDLWSRYRGALWKLLRGDRIFTDATTQEARLREYLGWK